LALLDNFNDSSSATVSLDLPVFDGLLLASQSGEPPDPEHTRTEMGLRSRMVEQESRLALEAPRVKGVLHKKEDVHIVWLGFRGDKGPEDNESRDLPRCLGDAIDSLQASGNHDSPGRARAEAQHGFMDRRRMNARRQVITIQERR
jgi:hypothetical protein